MVTLTEFLTARLDEDEAVAREVQAELRREIDAGGYLPGHEPDLDDASMVHGEGNMDRPAVIVGPARVLAEVEAKRRIVALHEQWPVLVDTPPRFEFDEGTMAARASQHIAWLTTQEYRARFGDEPPTSPILRCLALPYADHPDYREEWRP